MRTPGYGKPMSEQQIDEQLEDEAGGILAVNTAPDAPPYTVPMGFGYDGLQTQLVFQFVNHEESRKMQYIDDGTPAALCVYHHEPVEGWVSMIIEGSLSPIPDEKQTRAQAVFEKSVPAEHIDIFLDRDDYHTEWWGLTTDSVHGRMSIKA
jgi:nitroimidazol reductase NimA-like FMN-containing flavoprotein (pyridoxamine 5'-phosphate oxidase superfamily)